MTLRQAAPVRRLVEPSGPFELLEKMREDRAFLLGRRAEKVEYPSVAEAVVALHDNRVVLLGQPRPLDWRRVERAHECLLIARQPSLDEQGPSPAPLLGQR